MISRWLRRRLCSPPVGRVDFGALRQVPMVGGCPPGSAGALDRHLVEEFLARHAADIGGHVLEAGEGGFAARHGGARLRACTRLAVSDAGVDLPCGGSDGFDCILLPDTLHRVLTPREVLRDLHARLRPGGVLLATLPGTVRHTDGDACWLFTPYSARLLVAEPFGDDRVALTTRGNVLIALAHAHRLPASEVGDAGLRVDDPAFPFMIGVRAWRQALR